MGNETPAEIDLQRLARSITTNSKREAFASLFKHADIQATELVALHPDVHVGFQVVRLGTEDGLYAGTSYYHTGSTQFLQASLVNFGNIFHANTQTGDASIQRSDVLFTTEGSNQRNMCAIARLVNDAGSIRVERINHYFKGHKEMDQAFGWGFSWRAGRK